MNGGIQLNEVMKNIGSQLVVEKIYALESAGKWQPRGLQWEHVSEEGDAEEIEDDDQEVSTLASKVELKAYCKRYFDGSLRL